MIDLSVDVEFCLVEVALDSNAGVGPFSKPIIVKVRKMVPTTTKVTTQTKESSTLASTKNVRSTSRVSTVHSERATKQLKKIIFKGEGKTERGLACLLACTAPIAAWHHFNPIRCLR